MCGVCRHMAPVAWTCTAFPDGIPNALDMAGADHRAPLPGDHGVRFQPVDAAAAQYVTEQYGAVPTPYTGDMTVDDPSSVQLSTADNLST